MKSRFSYDHPLIPYEVEFDVMLSDEITEELQDILHDIHEDVQTGNRRLINPLKEWIKEYPRVPILKNHLFSIYMLRGKQVLARKTLKEIREKHPDYLIGITNEALLYINLKNKNLEKARSILGESLLLHDLVPDRAYFHSSEVINYYQATILLLLEEDNIEEAKKRNNILLELDHEHPAVERLTRRIALASLKAFSEKMEENQEKIVLVKAIPPKRYPKTKEAPQFNHSEVGAFYDYGDEALPGDIIEDIIKHPRETLAKDFETVLEDTFQRYLYFKKKANKADFWNTDELSFPTHTLKFLSVFHYHECLPSLLKLFRQEDDFLDFWFSDIFEDAVFPYLFQLADDHLGVFKQFVMEPNVTFAPKIVICKAVGQLALHDRNRLSVVSQWLEDVLHFFLKNINDKNITDSNAISAVIMYCINLKLNHLLPTIKAFYDTNLVNEFVLGDYESIKKNIEGEIEEEDVDPVPRNISEAYDGSYWDRKKIRALDEEDIQLMNQIDDDPYNLSNFLPETSSERDFDTDYEEEDFENDDDYFQQRSITPAKSEKISRNASCPCGSGKKYKRCCWKK